MTHLHGVVSIPSAEAPITGTGRMSAVWYGFFASMVANAPPIEQMVANPSPFTYTASVFGSLLIIGGTVSNIALTRSEITINPIGVTSGFIPLSLGDQLVITYTVAPVMWFIPVGATT